MARQSTNTGKPSSTGNARIYEMEVALLGCDDRQKFAKRKRHPISRVIAIRGDQTLEQLHGVIFIVFDRYDPHMYEFQVGGDRMMDPKARRYVLPEMLKGLGSTEAEGDVETTTIDEIGLKIGEMFGYWFDFGDSWMHRLTVLAIREDDGGHYPDVISSVGKSPPQYPDHSNEDE